MRHRLANASSILFAISLLKVIKNFSLPFYLISYGNFASLFENFRISLLKWTSTYMFDIKVQVSVVAL